MFQCYSLLFFYNQILQVIRLLFYKVMNEVNRARVTGFHLFN